MDDNCADPMFFMDDLFSLRESTIRFQFDAAVFDGGRDVLDFGMAGATEWVEDIIVGVKTEAFDVFTYHMWREGQHKPIPAVYSEVLCSELVKIPN